MSGSKRVYISTVPYGRVDRTPLELLERIGSSYTINPTGRRLSEAELADRIGETDVLIAGTEPITDRVMQRAPHLRLITRVGVGLDNVDLSAARKRGIEVAYTPDAPAPAVAELAVGMMLSLLRNVTVADRGMRKGSWQRYMGRRLSEVTVGIIGVGRIGKRVVRHLQGFGGRVLANDIAQDVAFGERYGIIWTDKETIFREADVITLHVPLTKDTRFLINKASIARMKRDALLVNTSRGAVVCEADIAEALRTERIGGAAIDVFEQEPYAGNLTSIENCILTCHMGSCSSDCRARMEIEATQEAVRFLKGEPLQHPVPEAEYLLQGSKP